MKKISIVFLGLLALLLTTGCGPAEKEEKEVKEQTLVCTTTEKDKDMDTLQVISMTYKNDKLKHMTMEVNSKITDSTVKENWEKYKELMDENNQEFNKDGVSLRIEVDDNNYEYNTILDIDIDNVSEEDLKEQGLDGLKEDTGTLEENKKLAENDGATCVVK